jgi:predicted fused transcriptional regulator/phosphomethylpyrimidine kinase
MNIAACTADAESIDDVCAFPGRLAAVSGTIRPIEPAAYGVSNHLANVLLRARKRDSDKGAILNLRPKMKRASDTEVNQRAVAKACDSLEWVSTTASRGVVALDTEFVDIIVDAGDFGWEPTLYVLANNPLELIERTHTFLAALA